MRPANAVVKLNDTSANGVALAIKLVRRQLDRAGMTPLIFRSTSKLYAYQSPSKRRKVKAAASRKRARRREHRRALWDDYHDRGGDRRRADHPNSAGYPRRPGATPSPASITASARSSASAQEAVID